MSASEGNWYAFDFEQQTGGFSIVLDNNKKEKTSKKRGIFFWRGIRNTVDGEHDRLKICLREGELVCCTAADAAAAARGVGGLKAFRQYC